MRSSVKFEFVNPEKWRVRNAGLANVFFAPFSTVQHHDQVDHFEPRVAQCLHRAQRVAARGDDVLDHRDAFSDCEAAFELFGSAITLRLLAHEQQRQSSLDRHRASEQDSAQLGCGEALGCIGYELRKVMPQSLEQNGIGLEEKLVEVAIRATA